MKELAFVEGTPLQNERMADDLLSLRIIAVSQSPSHREMLREAATAAQVPIEFVANDRELTALRSIAAGGDLVFLDLALGGEAVARLTAAARATASRPVTISLCAAGDSVPFPTDALAIKPVDQHDANRLLAGAIRLRLPSRVLLVDDSPTMRGIVRKVLAATGFPLDVMEADQGGEALALARTSAFDFIFFDYNLPGLSGLEAIAEVRRARRYPACVLMTSTDDATLAEKARAQGVVFLKKPFYPEDIERILCGFCGLRAVNPAHRGRQSRARAEADPVRG
jgi:CheY-like chemotaxis protein